jgi:hypothetical protein
VFAIISTKNHVTIQILLCVLLKSLQPRVLYRAFDEAQAVETTWVLNIHSSLSYWGEFSLSSWGAQEKLFVLYNLTMVYECMSLQVAWMMGVQQLRISDQRKPKHQPFLLLGLLVSLSQ